MGLPEFKYIQPSSIKELSAHLSQHGQHSRLVAGGTDLLIALKQGLDRPDYLVDLKSITGLNQISYQKDSGIIIGALTSLREVGSSPIINTRIPILAQAANSVGAIQHRQMGTIGGNLCLPNRCMYYNKSEFWRQARTPCYRVGGEICHVVNMPAQCHAAYTGDTAPALLALGARVKIVSAAGERVVDLTEFFTGDALQPNSLQSSEVITEILIPEANLNDKGVYQKYRHRSAVDFPLAGVAVQAKFQEQTGNADLFICQEIRVAITGVWTAPLRVSKAEELIRGLAYHEITPQLTEEFGTLVSQKAKPVNNLTGSQVQRRRMTKIMARDALQAILVQYSSERG